jgi:hypothetical protein
MLGSMRTMMSLDSMVPATPLVTICMFQSSEDSQTGLSNSPFFK